MGMFLKNRQNLLIRSHLFRLEWHLGGSSKTTFVNMVIRNAKSTQNTRDASLEIQAGQCSPTTIMVVVYDFFGTFCSSYNSVKFL